MIRHALHTGWTLRAAGGPALDRLGPDPVPAEVPGSVHTDLLAAGLIPDPYAGTNEADLTWTHRSAWLYETTLDTAPAAPGERTDLVFDGLDTVAVIRLDGVEVGRTANMHRCFRFDVRERLTGGPVGLQVRFDSALEHAEREERRLGERPRAYPHPYNAIRKMACSFGWDWGPDLQTAGLWRPVRLERWRTARLAGVRPLATLDADGRTGRLTVHAGVEHAADEPAAGLSVRVTVAGRTRTEPVTDRAVVRLTVPDAPVWWPRGYGEQPLAEVTVDLLDAAGTVLDSYRRRVGFRAVALDQSPDAAGSRFALVVNGREVFVLGLNWIPEDHLLTRLTPAAYAAAVDRAVDAHANLLRVWGGGIYESDDFYDACDERGVLVWQDAALACAAYAEEEPLRSEILAEVRENVTRLSPHPSLILWNGGNENLWGHEDWGWKEQLGDRTWGAGYYHRDFPALLAELDPTRPYHPGSPSSPGLDPAEVHPNDPRHGTRHEWDAWNRRDYTWHDRSAPRFCSEFGWQAPPAWSTLAAALGPDGLRRGSAAFAAHQKAEDGEAKLAAGLARHVRVPDDLPRWHWAAQLVQARATAYAVEHLRALAPHTMGGIVWQLNDCWPVISWSMVDSAGHRKPAWYALRRSYAPRLLTFQERAGELALVLVNDTDEEWRAAVVLRRTGFDGTVAARAAADVTVAARGLAVVPLGEQLRRPGDPAREVLVADAGELRAVRLFAEDRDLAYDPEPVTVRTARVEGGYAVTVTATSFARDVAVLADRVAPDAVAGDLIDALLPGESRTVVVRTAAVTDPAAFAAPEVLCSANSLSAAAGASGSR